MMEATLWKYWSRIKLGKRRVYWAVGVYCEHTLITDGYAETILEAEEQAQQAAGPETEQATTNYAGSWHREKVAANRKPSSATGAEVRTYVYRPVYRECDYPGQDPYPTARFPILRWSKRKVYVSRD